jgi:hypothetical protein
VVWRTAWTAGKERSIQFPRDKRRVSDGLGVAAHWTQCCAPMVVASLVPSLVVTWPRSEVRFVWGFGIEIHYLQWKLNCFISIVSGHFSIPGLIR